MIQTIKSFGCSFLAGTDLDTPSHAWPAVIANNLGMKHVNYARPGIGNLQILESVLNNSDPDSINIISCTWIDRFDFCSGSNETWETLRPSLDHPLAETYFKKFHGQYKDMLASLIYIQTSIDYLVKNRYSFLMTAMDLLIFEKVEPTWHDPRAIDTLQKTVRPHIVLFEDKTFLNWSRDQRHPVSDKWHPLESAHLSAASIMTEQIRSLTMKNTTL